MEPYTRVGDCISRAYGMGVGSHSFYGNLDACI